MKLIEDLGMQYPTENSRQKEHMGIFECEFCGKNVRVRFVCVERGQKTCQKCVNKKPNRDNLLYGVWNAMKSRCYIITNRSGSYLSKGIVVCDAWRFNYNSFFEWAMNNGYKKGLQIDRINNDGNYDPSNCRWVTPAENCHNRGLMRSSNKSGYAGVTFRKNRRTWAANITYNGKRKTIGTFKDIHLAAVARNNYILQNGFNLPMNPIPPEYQHLLINNPNYKP